MDLSATYSLAPRVVLGSSSKVALSSESQNLKPESQAKEFLASDSVACDSGFLAVLRPTQGRKLGSVLGGAWGYQAFERFAKLTDLGHEFFKHRFNMVQPRFTSHLFQSAGRFNIA